MLSLLSPLMVLLSLVGINNGQEFGDCDYSQDIDPGKEYYVFNTNYPQNYEPGSSCRWVATSDQPIKLSCNPFSLPASPKCSEDALIIQDGSNKGHRYCGNGKIDLVSTSNQFTLTLISSGPSNGGKFLCSLKTVESPDDTDCRCGWKNPTRIVGGKETGVNEYPMMCGLIDSHLRILFCGATIINERQVITAAHCVSGRNFYEVGVLVGEHDLSNGAETNATKLFRVATEFTIHPLYDKVTQDYDIAIITILGRITFSQQVGPVCLPFQHSPDTFGGSIVEVLGWGSAEFAGGPANTLQGAELSVVTNAVCSRTYKDLSTRQLCTQESGRDSCQFDSGGPVLWQNPTSRRLVEIGIISLGSVCADGEPAVNTRVGAFIEWIVSQTPPGISYCKVE